MNVIVIIWCVFISSNAFLYHHESLKCEPGQDCIIDCSNNNQQSCTAILINGSTATSLTVYCNYAYSCQNTLILCPESECNIVCSDVKACRYLIFEPDISVDKINLTCSGQYSCNRVMIQTNLNTNANVDIVCSGHASCNHAQFKINGNNGNASLVCSGEYACDLTIFNITNMNQISLLCSNYNACTNTDMYAFTANSFTVLCNEKLSCYGANIYCPSSESNICFIQCSNHDYSCKYLDIFVENDNYVDQYLDIQCPVNTTSNDTSDTCASIEFNCPSFQTSLAYDDTTGVYECSDNYCCPNQQWITTLNLSSNPTISSTNIPTNNETSISKIKPRTKQIMIFELAYREWIFIVGGISVVILLTIIIVIVKKMCNNKLSRKKQKVEMQNKRTGKDLERTETHTMLTKDNEFVLVLQMVKVTGDDDDDFI